MQVIRASDGECEIGCIVPETLVNAAGFAHGAIAFALMDTACAYSLGTMELRGVTLNGNTTYVKGAEAGSKLLAMATIVSRTRRVVTLRAEVLLADAGADSRTERAAGELAAHGTFVFQILQ